MKDVFADITNPIMESSGEIYQYVGDEIVISWPMNQDINGSECIFCFFEIDAILSSFSSKYQQRYGVSPVFKAGAHCGAVIAGEIGIIKRDITYSGDILNTTARIQSQCNILKCRLLISYSLNDLITVNNNNWTRKHEGTIELKGKKKKLELFSVTKTG